MFVPTRQLIVTVNAVADKYNIEPHQITSCSNVPILVAFYWDDGYVNICVVPGCNNDDSL